MSSRNFPPSVLLRLGLYIMIGFNNILDVLIRYLIIFHLIFIM